MIDTSTRSALARALRPLVALMLRRGVGWSAASALLRRLFVAVAERDLALPGRRPTDSRLSLLTGLQRREIKALRAEPDLPSAGGHGLLPRVLARWHADPAWLDANGAPRRLDPRGADGFPALVAAVGRDLPARTVLDEALRVGAVHRDADGLVTPAGRAVVPSGDDAALLGYLGANLGDHAEAAVANVAAAPGAAPFYERATHANRLTPASVAELDAFARRLLQDALAALNDRAAILQARDAGLPEARHRFRAGAYVYNAREGGEAP